MLSELAWGCWLSVLEVVDQAMLARHLKGVTSGVYYVTGPAAMVKGLRGVLRTAGVDDDDIRTEEFSGY